jgi:hypothetical protein
MKKILAILVFAFLAFHCATAQIVTVEISLDQNQFLPAETLPVTVRVINNSGQTLHLGADNQWLTFNVQSLNNNSGVAKLSDPPVVGTFELGSSEVAIKHVDIQPYFSLKDSGRYRVVANIHIPEWNMDITSDPKEFDIINGAEIWSQAFGLPVPAGVTNRLPEVRKYVLEEANYLQKQLRMYLLVTDDTGNQIFKVSAIGPMVSFSQPEAQLDDDSNLHVIYQSGGQSFLYSVISPDGNIILQDVYDYVNTRPHLSLDTNGHIVVIGGVRREKPGEMPAILPPSAVPMPTPAPK